MRKSIKLSEAWWSSGFIRPHENYWHVRPKKISIKTFFTFCIWRNVRENFSLMTLHAFIQFNNSRTWARCTQKCVRERVWWKRQYGNEWVSVKLALELNSKPHKKPNFKSPFSSRNQFSFTAQQASASVVIVSLSRGKDNFRWLLSSSTGCSLCWWVKLFQHNLCSLSLSRVRSQNRYFLCVQARGEKWLWKLKNSSRYLAHV